MFDVTVSQDVIEHARQQVADGNFGRRRCGNGTKEQQVTGLIGQIVIHDLFGVPRPRDLGCADCGVDLMFEGMSLDVKTMGRNVRPLPSYTNNFSAAQQHFATDVLIFCSYQPVAQVLTVCGWIRKPEFLRRAKLHAAGTIRCRRDGSAFQLRSDTYEIRNSDLYDPASFSVLVGDLHREAVRPTHSSQRAGDQLSVASRAGRWKASPSRPRLVGS